MSLLIKIIVIIVILAGLALFVVLFLSGGDFFKPSEEGIQKNERIKQFLQQARNIKGIYKNDDIDALVFTYETFLSEYEFWETVKNSLDKTDWLLIQHNQQERFYERVIPKNANLAYCSSEEIRIGFRDKKVVVAWVQGDSSKNVNSFRETKESEFAQWKVWPIFNDLMSNLK